LITTGDKSIGVSINLKIKTSTTIAATTTAKIMIMIMTMIMIIIIISTTWENNVSLTIIPRARMGSESIAHEAEGRMGYW